MALAPIIPSPSPAYHDTVSPVIQSVATYDAPTSPTPNLDDTISHLADEPSQNEASDVSTPVAPPSHGSPFNLERSSADGAAAGPTRGTTDNSVVSSMVDPSSPLHTS
jgi:hypothetical protein